MEESIGLCKSTTKLLFNSSASMDKKVLKDLITHITNLIMMTSRLAKEKFENVEESCCHKSVVILFFNQLISSIQLQDNVNLKELEIGSILKECRNSICNRMIFCFENILNSFNADASPSNLSGCFLRWIDRALEKITEINLDAEEEFALTKFIEAKLLFEDVLAHAMTIAQICLIEDQRAITGRSQAVLESLGKLEKELTKDEPNKALVNLFIDLSGDKLCSLERKVDIAILRLCLQIFSKYHEPLEEVVNCCKESIKNRYKHRNIDDIVADFDLHVDRLMQIGFFAVYCTSNMKRGIKIRNHMASLEFLESELIPVNLLLLSDSSETNKAAVDIFRNYWIQEADELKRNIFEIIDPSAFCQVICDEIGCNLDRVLKKLKTERDFSKEEFSNVICFGKVFKDFISTAMNIEDGGPKHDVQDGIKRCLLILTEILKADELLEDNCKETNERMFKRCKIFKSELKKLISSLVNDNEVNDNCSVRETIEDNDYITNDDKFLNYIMKKGVSLLKNRSVMYRNSGSKMLFNHKSLEQGKVKFPDFSLKKLSVRKLNFSFDHTNESQSIELQVTEILDNLNSLNLSIGKI